MSTFDDKMPWRPFGGRLCARVDFKNSVVRTDRPSRYLHVLQPERVDCRMSSGQKGSCPGALRSLPCAYASDDNRLRPQLPLVRRGDSGKASLAPIVAGASMLHDSDTLRSCSAFAADLMAIPIR